MKLGLIPLLIVGGGIFAFIWFKSQMEKAQPNRPPIVPDTRSNPQTPGNTVTGWVDRALRGLETGVQIYNMFDKKPAKSSGPVGDEIYR